MSHMDFIVAAYAVAALVLGLLIVLSVADYSRQKRRLAALERDRPEPGA